MPIYLDTPLYKESEAPRSLFEKSHLGLWFTRFFNQYDETWQIKKEVKKDGKVTQEEGKKKWISSVAHEKCGGKEALENYKFRTLNLIKTLKGKQELQELDEKDFAICTTNWNFVTGMGLPHPVENGMSWHHTLGVPYLAGSSIKGLLRAWVEGGWDEDENLDESIRREQRHKRRQKWFGMVKGEKWDEQGKERDEEDQAGKLIFFDAIPIEQVTLVSDIMTPHYGKWYAEGDKIEKPDEHERIPADWHDPVPVPFLAVQKDAKFLVTVVARDKNDDLMAREALQELVQALQWLGAGAKTAAGYGHFVRNEEIKEQNMLKEIDKKEEAKKKAAEKEAQLNELSESEVYLALSTATNQTNAEQKAKNFLDIMEAAEPDDDKHIALQIKAFYEKIGKWKKTKGKQKKNVKRVKKILGEI